MNKAAPTQRHGSAQTIDGHEIVVDSGLLKQARLRYEWIEDLADPTATVAELRARKTRADFFTFWQRIPHTEPQFHYYRETESIAVLPLTDFDTWWKKQISAKTRNVARKAEKSGVTLKVVDFDDKLVAGICEIFNETPIRQNRRFLHYGKSPALIREEMSRRNDLSIFLGAYLGDELIGFIKLLNTDRYSMAVEILSKIAHRDKSPTNGLLRYAVEICCERKVPHLVYAKWLEGPLGDFKRHNGFERMDLPRYYVALSLFGKAVLRAGMLAFVRDPVPARLRTVWKDWRAKFHQSGAGKE